MGSWQEVVTILLGRAPVFNLPAVLQRAILDYTGVLQEQVGGEEQLREKLNLGGLVTEQNAGPFQLQQRRRRTGELRHGAGHHAASSKGSTPRRRAGRLEVAARQGGADRLLGVLVHQLPACDHRIWSTGMTPTGIADSMVICVRTPPSTLSRREEANVVSGAKDLGITYPVAMDNAFSTWTNYRNRYWPAHYLLGQTGRGAPHRPGRRRLRHHRKADPPTPQTATPRPAACHRALRQHPDRADHAEDLPSVGKVVNYGGPACTTRGTHTFELPRPAGAGPLRRCEAGGRC